MTDTGEMTRLPQVDQKLRESGYPAPPEDTAARGGQVSSLEEMAANVAHDVNNPLTVVFANLEFLADMISRMGTESGLYLEAPEGREWLRSHLTEADVCLGDLREATERIRVVVQNLRQRQPRPLHERVEQRASGFPIEPRTDTKRNVLRQARVLVVDDQEDVAKALGRMLRGHDVVVLVSAREALARILEGERFDVILCDLMMPEMMGSVLYEEIKRLAPEQAARMIFITGGAATAEAANFLSNVTQPVIGKPFDPTELRVLVRTFLQ